MPDPLFIADQVAVPHPTKILLIGCGDLAARLAGLRASRWCFTGLRRRAQTMPGIDLVTGDACSAADLQPLLDGVDMVVATLTPSAFTEEGYVAGYVTPAQALRKACEALSPGRRPQRIFWVSSTRVYGESAGEWVDEATPPRPQGFAGRRLLEAESVLEAGVVPVTVVRFSGIYGPGRNRLRRAVQGGRIAPAAPLQWTNRIHSDDCGGVLAHLIDRELQGTGVADLYIGSDCEPAPAHDVQRWLARRLGVSPVEETGSAGPGAGRRCSNQRLLESGYRFRYPSWREGYGEQAE